ncbi:hypothetical protein D3C84_1086000 [compost metagenome]
MLAAWMPRLSPAKRGMMCIWIWNTVCPAGLPLNWATCTPSGCSSSISARVSICVANVSLHRLSASISRILRAAARLGITSVWP